MRQTNENAHLTTHEPIKIRVIKVKIKLKFVTSVSKGRVDDGDLSFESSQILSKIAESSVKTRINIQNIRFCKERTLR